MVQFDFLGRETTFLSLFRCSNSQGETSNKHRRPGSSGTAGELVAENDVIDPRADGPVKDVLNMIVLDVKSAGNGNGRVMAAKAGSFDPKKRTPIVVPGLFKGPDPVAPFTVTAKSPKLVTSKLSGNRALPL
jgi:hypothetical protein